MCLGIAGHYCFKKSNMKFKKAKTYTIKCMRKGISLKNERNDLTHDLNHDLTFYCIPYQLYMSYVV